MPINYLYKQKELGSREVGENMPTKEPQSWTNIPNGEPIRLCPTPNLPYSANKNGDDMIIYGLGGAVLDDNHDVELTDHEVAGEQRKVRMRCP